MLRRRFERRRCRRSDNRQLRATDTAAGGLRVDGTAAGDLDAVERDVCPRGETNVVPAASVQADVLLSAFAETNCYRRSSCGRNAAGNLGAVEWLHAPGGESGVVPATFVQSDALPATFAQTTLLPATFV